MFFESKYLFNSFNALKIENIKLFYIFNIINTSFLNILLIID